MEFFEMAAGEKYLSMDYYYRKLYIDLVCDEMSFKYIDLWYFYLVLITANRGTYMM